MKIVAGDFDFADASYSFCKADENDLLVYLNSWDDRILKIKFFEVLRFIYKEGSVISGIFERTEENIFLKEALSSHYIKVPKEHPYKSFVIIDIDDEFVFEVVAQEVMVSKE